MRIRRMWVAVPVAAALLLAVAAPVLADEFEEDLARVDQALKTNPAHVPEQALASCEIRRNSAVRLYDAGEVARAHRRLEYCMQVLKVSEKAPAPKRAKAPSMQELQEQAGREFERALVLAPDLENGLKIYRGCAACHGPEGWGLSNGSVPQLAGQHRQVVIKQLADIRSGHREAVLMLPYASVEAIGGPQAVADVAGYIDTLEISVDNGKGPGDDLELGQRLYGKDCARCHGAQGEGNDDKYVPRLQAQHYGYLVTQLERIRDGKRRNANAEMVAQIQGLGDREVRALSDYLSRLEPPEDLRAPPGWHNPDFAH